MYENCFLLAMKIKSHHLMFYHVAISITMIVTLYLDRRDQNFFGGDCS